MKTVLVTDHLDDGLEFEKKQLGPNFRIEKWGTDQTDAQKAILAQEAVGLLVWHQKIDESFVSLFPNLKAIVRYGAGTDNVDQAYLQKQGICFDNVPDYGVDEVSDHALAGALFLARRLGTSLRLGFEGQLEQPRLPGIRRLKSQRVGVMGLGRIGTAFALKARAMFQEVLFFDPNAARGIEKSLGLHRVESLAELLKASNVLSIHCPLLPSTQGVLTAELLEQMPEGSLVINTARGGILPEFPVILDLIKCGRLGGVFLDVLEKEPFPEEYRKLLSCVPCEISEKIWITPHNAYFSQESFEEMRSKAALKIRKFLEN